MWGQINELEYSFLIVSEQPVSHEAYSTSRSGAAMSQIRSESLLHPGKHVATTLGCSNIFWNKIVNVEWNKGRHYSQKWAIWVCGTRRVWFLSCFGQKVGSLQADSVWQERRGKGNKCLPILLWILNWHPNKYWVTEINSYVVMVMLSSCDRLLFRKGKWCPQCRDQKLRAVCGKISDYFNFISIWRSSVMGLSYPHTCNLEKA